jgi:hypothetical protein
MPRLRMVGVRVRLHNSLQSREGEPATARAEQDNVKQPKLSSLHRDWNELCNARVSTQVFLVFVFDHQMPFVSRERAELPPRHGHASSTDKDNSAQHCENIQYFRLRRSEKSRPGPGRSALVPREPRSCDPAANVGVGQ